MESPGAETGAPVLTIALPTYGRAELLDAQFAWIARAIDGAERSCELLVSDNCSADATPEVIERWCGVLERTPLPVTAVRQVENIGAIRNIAWCIEQARGSFVWTISDDDTIDDGALAFVLETIRRHPDLQSLILNFSARDYRTGELKYDRCFEIDDDQIEDPGTEIVERALHHPRAGRWGGLVLTTAQVYRTSTAQAALRAWPEGLDNLYLQFFVTAYCARQGLTIMTRDTHLEMASGRHFFSGDDRLLFDFRLAGMAESLVQVADLGYERELCLEKAAIERARVGPRQVLRYLLREPRTTVDLLRRHRTAVRRIAGGAGGPPARP
jgi:abequosyltransferase